MSVFKAARRLKIFHSPPFISSFSSAFYRTISTSHLLSTQQRLIVEPLAFTHQTLRTHGPLDLHLLESLKRAALLPTQAEAVASIDGTGIVATRNLVHSAIWELREEWRMAILAFKWGQKWGCIDDEACELMVWVLGNQRKFNIAWTFVLDLHRSSMITRLSMLIMMDRYAAANNPAKAIWTFHMIEKFRLAPGEEAFYSLLYALCRHGNMEEAEEFMIVNKRLFPLAVEGFNIILNGWCNICVDVVEAKRVWREMSKCSIAPDAASYTHMISCFSKVGNLFESLRLYDEMKRRDYVPCLEVYNSLIYVLCRENCHKEALKIVDKMKETGLQPNSSTYNLMIRPLCQANKLEEARNVLAIMMQKNLSPTMETYHAFLDGTGFEGTLEILNRMRIVGLSPTGDTFLLVLAKFFKLKQPENALKIWVEMKRYEVVPVSAHYRLLVEGLAKCGLLAKASDYYSEMRINGFVDDSKLQKFLTETVRSKYNKLKMSRRQNRKN